MTAPRSPGRRTTRPAAAVLVAGLLAGLAACSAGSSGSSGAAAQPTGADAPSPSAPVAPAASVTPAASVPASAAGTPSLEVALTRTSADGARLVAVTAAVTGLVPQVVDGAGDPLAPEQTEVMGTHTAWGDGGEDGSDPGDVTCTTGGTLVRMQGTFELAHTYAAPGDYTVTFTAGACPPLQDVTRTLRVTVR